MRGCIAGSRPLLRPLGAGGICGSIVVNRRRRGVCQAKGGKPSQRDFSSSAAPEVSPTNAPSTSGQEQQQAPPAYRVSPQLQASISSSSAIAAAPPSALRKAWRRLLKELSDLPRAIGIMATIAGLSGLGTVIPQNKPLDFYMDNYPEGPSQVLGFVTYKVLLGLQLDHIYSAWYFYGAIGLLAASLAACSTTTQWPVVKVAQRWRFQSKPEALRKLGRTQVLPSARVGDLGSALSDKGYQVFVDQAQGSLYAFKGLAGRFAPIGVHGALLLVLFGTAYSGFGGWKGSAMVPEGAEFVVGQALRPAGQLAFSQPSSATNILRVNSFSIDTRPDGSVAQFYSDLSLLAPPEQGGNELLRRTIRVNSPFRYGGITMYQTDWSLAALSIQVQSSSSEGTSNLGELLRSLAAAAGEEGAVEAAASGGSARIALPLASMAGRGSTPENAKLWATFLPLEAPPEDGRPPRGISMLAGDLQTVTFYDSKGAFAGVRRAGSGKALTVEGVSISVDAIVGSTGLELKSDPGVPWVYAGFGALMITTMLSYLSHSQVWALQEAGDVWVVGRSNRSKLMFDRELDEVIDLVPDLPAAKVAAGVGGSGGQAPDGGPH